MSEILGVYENPARLIHKPWGRIPPLTIHRFAHARQPQHGVMRMSFRRRHIVLDDDGREALFEQDPSTAGDGGFQNFLVKLQGQYRSVSQELAFDDDDLDRARRYASDYGHGTWENRLRRIFGDELNPEQEPEE